MSIQKIASKGRYGDNHLLHVSDAEVQGLNALANELYGHGLTTNPETGLPEAFLFAPFLAPLMAGGVGGALGLGAGSALATGLTAGALGAAEAELRGMDDPLQQGLMAGLTAGAGQALGNSLGQVGQDAAIQSAQGATNAPQFGAMNSVDMAGSAPMQQIGPSVYEGGTMVQPPMTMSAPTTPQSPVASTFGDKVKGFQTTFGADGNAGQFIKDNSMALATGMTGLAGTEALNQQAEQKAAFESQEAEKQAKYDQMVNRIKQNYASAGRELPTNPYGPLFGGPKAFAEGKKVEADKSFPDYQPEGTLKGTMFDYIPDAQQVSRWLQDQLPEKYRMPKKVDKRAGGGYLEGGIASLKGDGMSDSVPAEIDGSQPAALSTGEYVIPADVVSHLGNGSSDDGAVRLDEMLERVRMARTGKQDQAPQIKPEKYLPV